MGLVSFGSIIKKAVLLADKDNDTWRDKFLDAMEERKFVIAVCIYGIIIFFSVFTLALYHINLIRIHQTTNEHVKQTYREIRNPYDEGCYKNCKIAFCQKKSDRYEIIIYIYLILIIYNINLKVI